MKNIRCMILIFSLVVLLMVSVFAVHANEKENAKTPTTKSTYSIAEGITESALTLDGGQSGYMLQIAPSAKASLKASFSKYFKANSTKSSRSVAASSLGFSTMTTTAQAAAYETATGRDVIFTMNANFFDSDTSRIRGYLMVEGTEIHEPDSDCVCYFAVLTDGSYDIRSYTDAHDDVVEAVAGRQWLVRDGVQMSQNKTQLSARTAIGIKADGTVVCFVVDGKTNSTGVTINDMCGIMYSLGCVEAINLDGGGSSTFVTQRSSTGSLQIRNNPSDSTGERPVISTLMLVADPDTDHLYFDFTNNSAAINRYKADIYGGLNYDNGSWHYHHTYNTAPVFDHALGTMSFSTGPDCPTTRNIHPIITSNNTNYTSGHPLSYVPTGEDYFKIRMKIDGSADTDADFRLLYASDDGTSSSNNAFSCHIPAGTINNGYFVLEGYADFGGVDTVAAIRPEVYNLTVSKPATNSVTFTFDYIYVGPKEGAQTGNALYFDFSNSAEAKDRYNRISYGFLNFDSSDSPFWATAYNGSATALTVDNESGLLRVAVTDGYSGSVAEGNLIYGPWVKNTTSYGNFTGRNTYAYFPLSYDPKDAEIVQLRFRTENCVVPTGTTPRVVLEYYYIENNAFEFKNDIRKTFELGQDAQTISIPIPSTFTSADVIKCFGFRFQNIMGTNEGSVLIDYIYVGSACYAPEATHSWDGGKVSSPPTCLLEGAKTYTCTQCGHTKTESIPATGHTYVNGLCACGDREIRESIEETTWKINHTLELASDISVNLVVSKTLLEGFDIETVYILTEIETEAEVKHTKLLPVEQGNYYYFTLNGLTAVNMTDRIRSVLHGTKNGQAYYSATDNYSIADYAYSQMNKAGNAEELKTLCADLLRYGAKAQIFKNYGTDRLADAKMTDVHKAFLSPIDSVTFGNVNATLAEPKNAPIQWQGKALDLDSKVCLKFIFSLGSYTGDPANLSLRVRYADTKGSAKTVTLTSPVLYNANLQYYAFTLDTLLAAELRSVVSVQIYDGEIPVSYMLQYSADTYGNNKTGALLDLCKALFAYSDSAKAYFTM